jgi:hypothetical protein
MKNLLITNRPFIIGSILLLVVFMICTFETCQYQETQREKDSEIANKVHERNMQQIDLNTLTMSLEPMNIAKRIRNFQDENKISYIYLISFGKIMSFYTIKGKVTSSSKRLTATQESVYNSGSYSVLDKSDLDGTFGKSDEYIFFWTTDGTYVQWNDKYLLCDRPMKLNNIPEMVYHINKDQQPVKVDVNVKIDTLKK